MAKGFKTGGRTAGTLNKRTEAMLGEIASTGETPLQYMLRVMRDSEASPARRDAMAIAAAPYIHCKLAQADLTAQQQPKITAIRFLTQEEWLARRDAQQGNSRLIINEPAMRSSSTSRMNTSLDRLSCHSDWHVVARRPSERRIL